MMTSIGIFRRRYLSNLLAIVLAVSGLQAIAISSAPTASAGPALSWTQSTIAGAVSNSGVYGQTLATSTDGSKVFVAATNRAFLSTNYGVNWTTITALNNLNPDRYQSAADMSADGTKIYYAFKNQIYYSWDSGQTWTNKTFSTKSGLSVWSMDASNDGTKILITNRDSSEYDYSTNSGETWTQVSDPGGGGWAGAISGDGTKIIIANRLGTPRIGPLGGTLTAINLGALDWKSKDFRGAACDLTCTNILLANTGGGLFTSSDSGATWKLGTNSADSGFRNLQFEGADINSDGTRMAATVSFDIRKDVYISTDFGVTWRTQNVGIVDPQDVAIASTGSAIYALSGGDQSGNYPVQFARSTFPIIQTVACSSGGSFTLENNVVTTSTLDCAGAVVIPDGVTSIAANAFSRYNKLDDDERITSVTIPNTVTAIGIGAFRDNRNVSSLTIGTAVTSIGNDAFNNLYGLTTLVIPGSVTTIGTRAFANVNLTSLTLNEGLVTIGDSAFLGNKLVTLVIPNSVTTISTEAAFSGWGLIETLTLGSGLTTIGNRTFENQKLQSLTIPPGVTTLGADAFKNYAGSTYTYCGTSLMATVLNSAGLTGKTKYCQVAQTSALTVTSTIATYGSTLTLTTTGGNGSGSISFVVDSGPCTVVGSNLYSSNVGTCMVTATKAASSNYFAASSTSTAITVNKGTPTISLALPASATTATYGTAVTITATVSKAGKVTFKSGGTAITGCTLVSGSTTATCNWTPSAVNASTSLTADFAPDDSTKWENLTAAGSKTINVGKATQSVTNTATSTNFNLGQTDTLTATVTAGASGTVTFSAGGNTLCTTSSLDSAGIASCAWTPTTAGTYSVTSSYSGDSNYVTNTSTSSSIVVNSVITYDVNGGVGTAPTAFTSPGTSTTLPNGSTLSKSGYTFGGWSTTSSGSAVSSTYSSTISRTLYAVWTANQYVITYLANSGSGTQAAGSYTTGATATSLPSTTTFTRTGYTFGGWATSAISTAPVTSYSTSANVSFYAIWIHGTYTVTYNANGGSGTMAAQTSNATANLNANTFTYTDRVFNGWNTSADGTGTTYSNSVSYPFLANITLYAQWGNVITFSSQGATSGTPSQTSRSWSSGSINLPQVGTMVKAGYTFGGWSNGTTTYAGGASYTPTGGITLNPVWTANTYTISFNSNSASSGNVPANQTWTAGTTARTLSGNIGSPVLAKSGYTFGGWATTASSTIAVTTYSSFANQTFYAIWTPISYTITYALNGGTSALPTQANRQIYNTFTLAATPTKADYYFAGWSDSATATTYAALATYSITATSAPAITLTAQWIPTYTLNYVLNGSTSAVTGEGTYNSGTVVTLTAAPTRIGYTFNNWLDSSNVTHAAGSSFTMLQNSVLQAQWTAILYPVTYALNGATGTLPLQSSLAMNSPFIVSTASVRAGYTFGGWSDGTSVYPAGSTYVIGTSSVTLTAQWSAIPYSVTYDLGGGQGTLPTQADGTIGSTFTLPATGANPTWIAHTFIGWSDGAAVYAAGSTYTFGASNVTLTAQFSLNGYTQIAYSFGANGAGALPASTSALEGNTIVVASGSAVTRSNYAFAGWSDGSNLYQPGDVYLVGPEAAPITFVPNWTSGYNVAYSTGSGFGIAPVDPVGRVTGSTFIVGSAETLNRQGFTFTGWSDGTNVVQPGATYTVASANITLTAQWIQNSLAGIPSGALTPLANFSIVNGVSPTGSFNFGSTTISYTIPANALSAGTTVAIYGLTDTSSISGMLPGDKSVVSSTVISWLSTDGTVPDASSPIAMTITNSQIVPGTVVYAISGSSLVMLGTATTNGLITTTITSDPVIVILNAVVVTPPVVTPVVTAPVVTAPVVTAPAVVAVPMVMPTITSLTFVENAAKTGGKLVWVGTNIDSVLFTGTASTYPAPFNYGAFTLSWDGTLVNMVAGVTYTMKIEARSSSGGSESKTIEYTIAKPVIDTSAADAALKAAQEKAAAEKKAADEAAAAALKIAREKALAEAKAAAEAAAIKAAQEKAAAEAKAAEEAVALKVAQDKAAAEAKAAEEAAALKVAQDKAAAEAKAAEEAAALKIAQDKAAADAADLALAKKTPILNLFTWYASGIYSTSQNAKMKKLTLKLEPATTLKCVGYINTKGTTAAKAKATALAQAKTTCASAKKLNPGIKTAVTTVALAKAPKPLVGASNTKAKYRVDLFAYKG
jgi:uncharacterized repeat protein (TIGR02543 family)